jgi:putative transposase
MACPFRIEFPGVVYHITGRGNNRKEIFEDDLDRNAYLEILYGFAPAEKVFLRF